MAIVNRVSAALPAHSEDVAAPATSDTWARRRGSAWTLVPVLVLLTLALGVVIITAWSYLHGGITYLDNGEGFYLYPAQRLAQGAVLYRGVMATQPPVVYLIGAAAFKAGLSVAGVHVLGAALRALCAGLVYALGLRLFRDHVTASLGTLCYALLPIGLTWDRSPNSNSPLTLALLLAACVLVSFTPRSARLGGGLAALALFTKDLYLPLLAMTVLYLYRHQRRLLSSYLQGLGAALALFSLALLGYAGPTGLHDAFLGQGASPINPAWFVASLDYVVVQEGGLVLIALCGVWLLRRNRPRHADDQARQSYAPYLLAGSMAILLATWKEGTFGTVWQCAEPAVALLAASALVRTARSWWTSAGIPNVLLAGGLALLMAVTLSGIVSTDRAALAENNAASVSHVATLIHRVAPAGTPILAPPYYAALTATRIPGDASDIYIMAQRVRHDDRAALAWLDNIKRAVSAGRYPIVVTDQRIAALPSIMPALRRRYRPVYGDALPPSIHAVVWLPKKRSAVSHQLSASSQG